MHSMVVVGWSCCIILLPVFTSPPNHKAIRRTQATATKRRKGQKRTFATDAIQQPNADHQSRLAPMCWRSLNCCHGRKTFNSLWSTMSLLLPSRRQQQILRCAACLFFHHLLFFSLVFCSSSSGLCRARIDWTSAQRNRAQPVLPSAQLRTYAPFRLGSDTTVTTTMHLVLVYAVAGTV